MVSNLSAFVIGSVKSGLCQPHFMVNCGYVASNQWIHPDIIECFLLMRPFLFPFFSLFSGIFFIAAACNLIYKHVWLEFLLIIYFYWYTAQCGSFCTDIQCSQYVKNYRLFGSNRFDFLPNRIQVFRLEWNGVNWKLCRRGSNKIWLLYADERRKLS